MGRTKKLNSKITKNSKISKSKRANKKKNVRISKKKVGGGKKPENEKKKFGTVGGPRGETLKNTVNVEGFLERRERERRERERKRKEIVNEAASRYLTTSRKNPYELNADENFHRAKVALEYLLEVSLEYRVVEDAGEIWIRFLRSSRFKHRIGEIMLNSVILEYLKQLFYVLIPHYKNQIIKFLVGSAQTGDHIGFTDMGYMSAEEKAKAFPTWLYEKLNENGKFSKGTSVYQAPPV